MWQTKKKTNYPRIMISVSVCNQSYPFLVDCQAHFLYQTLSWFITAKQVYKYLSERRTRDKWFCIPNLVIYFATNISVLKLTAQNVHIARRLIYVLRKYTFQMPQNYEETIKLWITCILVETVRPLIWDSDEMFMVRQCSVYSFYRSVKYHM